MRKGKIYKITNLLNNKVYIGQTILDNPVLRWKDHYAEYKNENNQLFLYRAMRKNGITNFVFQIIEDEIDIEKLNEREEYWISFYKSNNDDYGYNLTNGGQATHNSKYTESFVRFLIQEIIKDHPEKSLSEIGRENNVTFGTMSDINCGDTWNFFDEKYPIRKHTHYKLNQEKALEIIEELKTGRTASDIAREYGVSVTNIGNINNGKIYRQDNLIYPIFRQKKFKKKD